MANSRTTITIKNFSDLYSAADMLLGCLHSGSTFGRDPVLVPSWVGGVSRVDELRGNAAYTPNAQPVLQLPQLESWPCTSTLSLYEWVTYYPIVPRITCEP